MTKIVINQCYGGFGLSVDASRELARRKGITLMDGVWRYEFSNKKWVPAEAGIFETLRTADGKGYCTSDIERDDPDLVAIVEGMGKAANGWAADLQIVEIPDSIEWQIEEYDGTEWVAERHQTWR